LHNLAHSSKEKEEVCVKGFESMKYIQPLPWVNKDKDSIEPLQSVTKVALGFESPEKNPDNNGIKR
jgi:hypothetical protein